MSVLVPNAKPPQRIIDPVAFFVALIGAPIVFALFTFWIFFIPVAAIVFGGPAYLVFGTPVMLWVMNRRDPSGFEVIGWALLAVVVMIALMSLLGILTGDKDWFDFALFYGGFGLIFAPCWAATFIGLYRWLCRDFYSRARPYS